MMQRWFGSKQSLSLIWIFVFNFLVVSARNDYTCPSSNEVKDTSQWASTSLNVGRVASVLLHGFDLESTYGVTTMWINLRISDKQVRPLLTVRHVDRDDPPLQLVIKENQLSVNIWRDDEPEPTVILSSEMHLPLDTWIHVGISWMPHNPDDPRSVTRMGLYINGQAVSLCALTSLSPKFGTNSIWTIGGDEALGLEGLVSHWGLWYNSRFQQSPSPKEWYGREGHLVQASFEAGWSRTKLVSFNPSHLYLRFTSEAKEEENSWSWELKDEMDRTHGMVQLLTLLGHGSKNHYAEYRDGTFKAHVSSEESNHSDTVARNRRRHVRKAMEHVFQGYREHAWGRDELRPISGIGHDNWGGMGTTLVDSLSTLWLLNMTDEFNEAKEWVAEELQFENVGQVSVFETTIRNLGGLLSAYDLTGEPTFLAKADDLGQRLLRAFDTPSGIPFGQTVLNATGQSASFNTNWHKRSAALSELGTMQVEFRYLARATGNAEYEAKAMRVLDLLEPLQPPGGLFPVFIDNLNAAPSLKKSHISMGALGDSFYEYLLKVWLQGGKRENKYRAMYDRAMDGVHKHIVHETKTNRLTYIAEMSRDDRLVSKMDHLACFMGGNLALGAYTHPDGLESPNAQRDLRVGKALAYTCYQMYAQTKTGIAPEMVRFTHESDITVTHSASHNILRPETIETFFILHFLTKDPVYRDWGWEIFLSFEEYCRTDIAYASLRNVNDHRHGHEDRMESFFLAETLKYLYLLHDPDTPVDILNEHVFNTEAHPLRMLDMM